MTRQVGSTPELQFDSMDSINFLQNKAFAVRDFFAKIDRIDSLSQITNAFLVIHF